VSILGETLLARPPRDLREHFERIDAGDATRMARRWLSSKGAPTRRDDAIAAVVALLGDPTAVAGMLARLPGTQRQLLEVVARYGGRISGSLLETELVARKLVIPTEHLPPGRASDPTFELRERGLLFAERDPYVWRGRGIRSAECPRGVLDAVKPAPVLAWTLPKTVPIPQQITTRAPDAAALEVLAVTRACETIPKLATRADGALAVPTRKRLEKELPAIADTGDASELPGRVDFAWQLMLALGVVDTGGPLLALRHERVAELLERAPAELSFALARAWLESERWQDGVGGVPGLDRFDPEVRFSTDELRAHRELLAWALGRLAVHPPIWLDLESFLLDVRAAAKELRECHGPKRRLAIQFRARPSPDPRPRPGERDDGAWLAREGELLANMLLVTLVHLGLVERATIARDGWAFRLTEVGRAVFGAPDVTAPSASTRASPKGPALVVQGDFDVLLHVAEADTATRSMLARIASLVSDGERISRYRLDASSIRAAVETGLTAERIRAFLGEASRTPVPPTVAVAIEEWCDHRGGVRLRGPGTLEIDEAGARMLSRAHAQPPSVRHGLATLDEHGAISGGPLVPIAEARLARLAERTEDGGLRITEARVRAARAAGVPAPQIESWIEASTRTVPPLFKARLAFWLNGRTARAETRTETFLRIDDELLEYSIAASARFRALGVTRLARGFLTVDAARLPEVTRELAELGVIFAEATPDAPTGEVPPPDADGAKRPRAKRR
jgi:hypothetical protein